MYRSDTSRRLRSRRRVREGGQCSNSPSSASCRSPRCTATSCARSSTAKLGAIRAAISYGSLYPTLRRLQAAGWITEAAETPATAEEVPPLTSRRGRVVYKITAEGKERFAQLIAQAGPETYDDTGFGVHFAFFARTDQATRLRILEGRRRTDRGASRRTS